jgi:tetratricopeptide (TPR) repeat protein
MPTNKWLRVRYKYLHPELRQVLMVDKSASRKPHWSFESRLRNAIKKYPASSPLKSALIRMLRDKKRYLEAIQNWHQLKNKLRNKSSSYFQRASWAMASKKYRQAVHFLALCLRRDTGYFGETAHFWRAYALYRLGKSAEALNHLDSVSEDYNEPYFFGVETWSKSRLVAEIQK